MRGRAVLSLEVLSLEVLSLEVLSLELLSLEVLSLEVLSLEVLSLEVLSLERLSPGGVQERDGSRGSPLRGNLIYIPAGGLTIAADRKPTRSQGEPTEQCALRWGECCWGSHSRTVVKSLHGFMLYVNIGFSSAERCVPQ
ncbi:unnamed protein product [Gadus morhua 'NCC']